MTDQFPKVSLWLLALLTFSGTLAMHIFVPALPSAATALHASAGTVQMTISLYILGLAFGQLIYGPLSDRFGRRPVLMAGLALYAGAGLVAALAPNAHVLIAARLFQALGGCAGLVLGRAIVRDTAPPAEAARRLALMNLAVTIGPGIAPLAGSLLTIMLGWRSILYFLALFGVMNFVCAWRLLPETRQPVISLPGSSISRRYLQLLRSKPFLGYAVGGGCATTSMYAFVAAAPFIFAHQLHRPEHELGVYLAMLIAGIWLGSALASRLIGWVAINKLLIGSNLISVLAAFTLLTATLFAYFSLPLTLVTMFLFTLGVGVASPTALSQAISVDPHAIGSASGLYGFMQMVIGALCTMLAGLGDNPMLAASLVLSIAGVVAQLSFWMPRQQSNT